ncbi:MAG: flagellar motor stator protein MotA [Bacillota bacterium]|nr:flagellar motor stator protein MotA [Bacillota bacterium]
MDIFLILGIIIGFSAVVGGMLLKGASISVLMNPEAAMVIFIGTFAVVMNSFPKKEFLNIPKVIKSLFREKDKEDPCSIINEIVELAQASRKDGILSLESVTQNMKNKFMRKGLEMVVDGIEQEKIEEILSIEIDSMEERHRSCAAIFSTAGSSSPTLGVLGAVIGLIGALGNLNDVDKLGEMIASAFVATLYGIFFGYVICHPFASRLKRKSYDEISNMHIILEGVLAIQTGENPKNIENKLAGMLGPKDRMRLNKSSMKSEGK